MDREVISTMYFLAWTVNSAVWSATGYISGSVFPAVAAASWLALSIAVWWGDIRPIQRARNAEKQAAG
jgi:hypothetical protein